MSKLYMHAGHIEHIRFIPKPLQPLAPSRRRWDPRLTDHMPSFGRLMGPQEQSASIMMFVPSERFGGYADNALVFPFPVISYMFAHIGCGCPKHALKLFFVLFDSFSFKRCDPPGITYCLRN